MPFRAPYHGPMGSVLEHPENAGVLRYLAHGRSPSEAYLGPPPPDVDRWHLGTHPDVVGRLWDQLNAALPEDGRWLVYDTPALIHGASGLILATAIGTQYATRLLAGDLSLAVDAGGELVHTFATVGTTLDLPATFGPGWVFGSWDEREPGWLQASYKARAE
jgi:hypothetical protein